MTFVATSLALCYLTFGTPTGANIFDNLIMSNWKAKEPKQDDPFFNPFGLTFPLFDVDDDPMPGFMQKEATKEIRARKEARKAKPPKPWFSISEFLTLPEMSRKTKSEGRKTESGSVGGNTAGTAIPNDKITQTGDLAQTKSASIADATVKQGPERKARDVEDQLSKDQGALKNHLEFDLHLPEEKRNRTTTKDKTQSKYSFPKGLSDILIIFQKVGPKPKNHQLIQSPQLIQASKSDHDCDEFCRDGICEMRGPWNRGRELEHEMTINTDGTPGPTSPEMPHHKKSQLLGQYDRICILAIPIALGIGTLLFIFELRRIFKKMKKQAVLSTFEHQEC